MTTTAKALIPSKVAESSQTTQYTCNVLKTLIDNLTVTNTGSVNRTISINIVPDGASAGDANCIVHDRIITPDEPPYRAFAVIGHILEPGDFISTIASGAGLTIRASGREIT